MVKIVMRNFFELFISSLGCLELLVISVSLLADTAIKSLVAGVVLFLLGSWWWYHVLRVLMAGEYDAS